MGQAFNPKPLTQQRSDPILPARAWLLASGLASRVGALRLARHCRPSLGTRTSHPDTADTHQVLELHIQVFFDGEARIRDGFIEVRVQVRQHLSGWVTNGTDVLRV